jgi:hypothetical protein
VCRRIGHGAPLILAARSSDDKGTKGTRSSCHPDLSQRPPPKSAPSREKGTPHGSRIDAVIYPAPSAWGEYRPEHFLDTFPVLRLCSPRRFSPTLARHNLGNL